MSWKFSSLTLKLQFSLVVPCHVSITVYSLTVCVSLVCHLVSSSQHDFLRDGADLTVHLQHLLLLLHHTDMKHTEVRPTEIQRQEVAFLCIGGAESRSGSVKLRPEASAFSPA